jgi:hypothetical protein
MIFGHVNKECLSYIESNIDYFITSLEEKGSQEEASWEEVLKNFDWLTEKEAICDYISKKTFLSPY